jgi:hypothetical protein
MHQSATSGPLHSLFRNMSSSSPVYVSPFGRLPSVPCSPYSPSGSSKRIEAINASRGQCDLSTMFAPLRGGQSLHSIARTICVVSNAISYEKHSHTGNEDYGLFRTRGEILVG